MRSCIACRTYIFSASIHLTSLARKLTDTERLTPVRKVTKTATPRRVEPGSDQYHKCTYCDFACPEELVLHRHIANVHGVASHYVDVVCQESREVKEENTPTTGRTPKSRKGTIIYDISTQHSLKIENTHGT